MENEFQCGNCGTGFNQDEAKQTGGLCPECGADLSEITSSEPDHAKEGGPAPAVFVIVALLALGALFFFLRPSEKVKSVDELLAQYRDANAKTPMMIDKSTRLDRVLIEDKNVTFETTMVNVGSKDEQEELFKKNLEPFLADKYCRDKSSHNAMEEGISFGHKIFSNDKVLLYTIDINIDDC